MTASTLQPQVLAMGLEFPEGPAVHRNGDVYLVEIRGGRVSRWDGEALTCFAETGGGPNGSAFGPDGHLYVANNGGFEWSGSRAAGRPAGYAGGWIERIDAAGSRDFIVRHFNRHPLNAPNDLAFDVDGNLYFTDPGFGDFSGRIYFMTPALELSIASEGYKYCNGLAFDKVGARLLVAESYTGRVLALEVEGPGRLSPPALFAQLPHGQYPDGMCFDSSGRLLVAGAGGGTIHVFGDTGKHEEQIPVEDKFVTNLAFGGEDCRTLYATESHKGRLISFAWPVAGLKLFPDQRAEGRLSLQ